MLAVSAPVYGETVDPTYKLSRGGSICFHSLVLLTGPVTIRGAFTNLTIPRSVQLRLPFRCFHSESGIPSEQLCGVLILGLGLCKKMSRCHHGGFVNPSPICQMMTNALLKKIFESAGGSLAK